MSWMNRMAVRVALVLTAGVFPLSVTAQNFVTPTVAPTPGIGVTGQFAGQFIVVNNAPGVFHVDPHISGDLVCYTDSNPPTFTLQYFNLATKSGTQIPNPDTTQNQDFLCDVRGSVVAFTRNTPAGSGIMTFDTSASGQPVQVSPPAVFATGSAIGDATIMWEQFNANGTADDIFVYDRGTKTNQQIDPSAIAGFNNTDINISPDGTVAVWSSCNNVGCSIWKATLANGTWTAQQLQSQVGGSQRHPDSDGNFITYGSEFVLSGVAQSHVIWQPVNLGGGQVTEQVLSGDSSINPSISGGYIAFNLQQPGDSFHDLAVYDVANNVLYDVSADLVAAGLIPAGKNQNVDDISVTTDGKVRVVWQEGFGTAIYAYTFYVGSNLAIQKTAPTTAPAGSNIPYTITVTSNGPQDATSVTVSDSLPPGMTFVSCAPSTGTCTEGTSGGTFTVTMNFGSLAAGVSATATLVLAASSGLSAGTVEVNTATVSTSGLNTNPNNAASAVVTLTASTASIANTIGQLLSAGCIDSGGIANALTSKLATAQSFISAGDNQDAINALTALLNQIRAQAGKHIATSCTINGQTFNPASLLIIDVQSLIDSLRVGSIADPITGYVMNSAGVGVPGVTVSISNGTTTVATSMTDITGFYYFPTTNVLATQTNYTIGISPIPSPFMASAPPISSFLWGGSGLAFSFTLN